MVQVREEEAGRGGGGRRCRRGRGGQQWMEVGCGIYAGGAWRWGEEGSGAR